MEFSAPDPPECAEDYLPRAQENFPEALWSVGAAALETLAPSLTEAMRTCMRAFAAMLIAGLVSQTVSQSTPELASVAAVGALLLEPSRSLIDLGLSTVRELQEYGKLLLPVLASSLAARGGVTASTSLYVSTTLLNTVLSSAVSAVFTPMLWAFLALAAGHAALGEPLLEKIRDLIRWLLEWSLKLVLYLFTGYMAVTGVISGTADAAAGKAARIAISGAVPVVGGILSDAADAVLLSASTLGSGAGTWGIITVLAIFCAPALRIGAQYLLLKLTSALGRSLGGSRSAGFVEDFAAAMGLLTALVSTQMTLLLISTVCFLRGICA